MSVSVFVFPFWTAVLSFDLDLDLAFSWFFFTVSVSVLLIVRCCSVSLLFSDALFGLWSLVLFSFHSLSGPFLSSVWLALIWIQLFRISRKGWKSRMRFFLSLLLFLHAVFKSSVSSWAFIFSWIRKFQINFTWDGIFNYIAVNRSVEPTSKCKQLKLSLLFPFYLNGIFNPTASLTSC